MKHLIPVAACGLLFLFGCQKEDQQSAIDAGSPSFSGDMNGIYVVDPASGTAFQKVEADLETLQGPVQHAANKGGNAHAYGHYSGYPAIVPTAFYKSGSVTFSGLENSQGLTGKAHFTRTWGDNGENSFTYHMNAGCLMIDGNDAVYVGLISQVTGNDPTGFPVGAKVFFKIRDNGKGPGAPMDQYNTAYIINPSGTIPCEAFAPDAAIWSLFGSMKDVENASDIIEID